MTLEENHSLEPNQLRHAITNYISTQLLPSLHATQKFYVDDLIQRPSTTSFVGHEPANVAQSNMGVLTNRIRSLEIAAKMLSYDSMPQDWSQTPFGRYGSPKGNGLYVVVPGALGDRFNYQGNVVTLISEHAPIARATMRNCSALDNVLWD